MWGREVAALDLDTVDGPAFKPLPVAVIALLRPLGDAAAPELWLLVARTGAVAAILLAARLAHRLTPDGGRRAALAAALAAGGVLAAQGTWWHAAVGNAEGLFLALVLAAADRHLDGRRGHALALGVAAGLLRPELWPFLGLYGLHLWRAAPALRPALLAAPPALLAAWFLPELWGSGDALRSSDRARIPNPGQPATADRPALASLHAAAAVPLLPVLAASLLALAAPRVPPAARALGAGGAAWALLVALMAERGYSGEPRYALPGLLLLAVPAAVLVATRTRELAVAGALAVLVAGALRTGDVRGELRRAADDARLWDSLPDAVAAAGGPAAVLRAGRPVTGRYRGPGVAWALEVHKRVVGFDPRAGGVLLRSRIRPGAQVMPPAPPGARTLGRSARWQVVARPPRPRGTVRVAGR